MKLKNKMSEVIQDSVHNYTKYWLYEKNYYKAFATIKASVTVISVVISYASVHIPYCVLIFCYV